MEMGVRCQAFMQMLIQEVEFQLFGLSEYLQTLSWVWNCGAHWGEGGQSVELQTKVFEDFTIMKKVPTRASLKCLLALSHLRQY